MHNNSDAAFFSLLRAGSQITVVKDTFFFFFKNKSETLILKKADKSLNIWSFRV